MYDSVLNQLRSAGLLVDSFESDTRSIVRVKVEGDTGQKRSGWYRVFSVISKSGNTYYVGSYGNWKNPAFSEKGASIEYEGSTLSDEDLAAIKEKQRQAQQSADRERKAKQQNAAKRAADIWQKLPKQGRSDYLNRKKVAAFELGFSRGSVVVPVRQVNGDLVGLQFIESDGAKKFLTGTPKGGAMHVLGDIAQSQTVIIAEGYATAASLHMATQLPVVIAFDAGNLPKVVTALRKAYSKVTVIIAADDDTTGIQYAHKAASLAAGLVVIPSFTQCPPSNTQKAYSDFNDLHVQLGLEAVATQINTAMQSLQQSNKDDPNQQHQQPQNAVSNAHIADDNPPPDDQQPKAGYVIRDGGVYWVNPDSDDGESLFWICGHLEVLALARTSERTEWSVMLVFHDRDNQRCELCIPMRLFASDRGAKVLEELYSRGLAVDSHRNSKNRVLDYLQKAARVTTKRMRLVNRMGWHGSAYMSPVGVIGDSDEPMHYYSERTCLNRAQITGSLQGWQDNIARYCTGNPVLMFAVSIAFTGPLLEWVGYKTLGFHMLGNSSLGKSSLSVVAGSVCGAPNYVHTWNTTSAALESTASAHSDSILILDEINQADPFSVGHTVYQLGNEEGKARATDTGSSTRAQHKWRLVWLSNGERSLKEIQNRVGKITEAGQEMRLLHIRADLHTNEKERAHKGIYQNLHAFAHGAALSEHLKAQAAKNHGHAFQAFIQWLTSATPEDRRKVASFLHRMVTEFQEQHLSAAASGQARRAAMGFALVGECGELATMQGITGWQKGEARAAASILFKNFLADRGGEGNAEDRAILEQITLLLQTKAESNFTRWDKEEPSVDTHQPRSMTRWGFRKIEESHTYGEQSYSEEELYIFKEVFRKEICKDLDYKRACELLKKRGALITSKGKGNLYQKVLPGTGSRQTQVYFIKMSALQDVFNEPENNTDDNANNTNNNDKPDNIEGVA